MSKIKNALAVLLCGIAFMLPFCTFVATQDRFLSLLMLLVSVAIMALSCRIRKN